MVGQRLYKSNSLVSIIVPVYNLEKYVKRCVCNLLNATYQNIEVIVIDDGSNDMSHYICDELADMDNRVKVFHIKNSGVSFARNYALESCQGEYIVFVDGDDWLDDDWLERAIQEIEIHQADIFAGGFICDYNDGAHCRKTFGVAGVLSQNQCIEAIFLQSSNKRIFPWSVCGKLFRKDLWNEVRFDKKLHVGEDALAFFDVLLGANKIVYNTDVLYHYYQRRDSVTHKIQFKHIIDYLTLHKCFLQKINCLKEPVLFYSFECKYRTAVVRSVLKMYQCGNGAEFQNKLIKKIRKDIFKYLKSGWRFEKSLGVCKVLVSCGPFFLVRPFFKNLLVLKNYFAGDIK